MNPRTAPLRFLGILPWCLAALAVAPAAVSAESGPPAEAQRRAATLADIG